MRWAVVATPMGPVSVGVTDTAVCGVRLVPADAAPAPPVSVESPAVAADEVLAEAVGQLRAYFAGERTAFSLPVSIPDGRGSDFERAVWTALTHIPYGETRTYGEVAAAVGDPGAARAVGSACHRNPVPVIVPCHRVVGAGRKLVGFGAGLPRKRWLLELEARVTLERAWS